MFAFCYNFCIIGRRLLTCFFCSTLTNTTPFNVTPSEVATGRYCKIPYQDPSSLSNSALIETLTHILLSYPCRCMCHLQYVKPVLANKTGILDLKELKYFLNDCPVEVMVGAANFLTVMEKKYNSKHVCYVLVYQSVSTIGLIITFTGAASLCQ